MPSEETLVVTVQFTQIFLASQQLWL